MEQVTACLVRYTEVVRVLTWLQNRGNLRDVEPAELGKIAYEYAVQPEVSHVKRSFNLLMESELEWMRSIVVNDGRPSARLPAAPTDIGRSDALSASNKCVELAELKKASELRNQLAGSL